MLDGKIDWVVSDHACCAKEIKTDKDDPEDIFLAKSGFGGTEYLLSGLYSEGIKRGLSLNNIAKLVCLNPAQRYGLKSKGDIQEGFDADLVIFDPEISFFFFQAEDGIRDCLLSRGLGDVYKRQACMITYNPIYFTI